MTYRLNPLEHDGKMNEDFALDFENTPSVADDNGFSQDLHKDMAHMLDSITRIGGEVCRLRAEMDGLLEHNQHLSETCHKLYEVIDEKGLVNWDDFQLACDVFEDGATRVAERSLFKKFSH